MGAISIAADKIIFKSNANSTILFGLALPCRLIASTPTRRIPSWRSQLHPMRLLLFLAMVGKLGHVKVKCQECHDRTHEVLNVLPFSLLSSAIEPLILAGHVRG